MTTNNPGELKVEVHTAEGEGGARLRSGEPESDLPTNIGKPATRALIAAGYPRIEQLTKISEVELIRLHGVGPKAIERLRHVLSLNGLSFASGDE